MQYAEYKPYILKAFNEVLDNNLQHFFKYFNDDFFVKSTEELILKFNNVVGNEEGFNMKSVGEIFYLSYMGMPISIDQFMNTTFESDDGLELFSCKGLRDYFDSSICDGSFHNSEDLEENTIHELMIYGILLKKNNVGFAENLIRAT